MFTLTDPFLYTVSQSSGIRGDQYETLKPNINHIWCNVERFQPIVRDSLEVGNIVVVKDDNNIKHTVRLIKITARYVDQVSKSTVINWSAELCPTNNTTCYP